MDEFVHDLLLKPRVCATTLPQLTKRIVLEDQDRLEPRVSPLAEESDGSDNDNEDRTDERSDESDAKGVNGMAGRNGYSSEGEVGSDEDMG